MAALEREFQPKLATFLGFVLDQYMSSSGDRLDRANLPHYPRLHFGNQTAGTQE